MLVDDTADESGRWPAFAPAAAIGVVSMLSFQLFASGDTLGALNLYSGRRAGFDDQSQTLGAVFASHAAHIASQSELSAHCGAGEAVLTNEGVLAFAVARYPGGNGEAVADCLRGVGDRLYSRAEQQ